MPDGAMEAALAQLFDGTAARAAGDIGGMGGIVSSCVWRVPAMYCN